MQGLHQYLTTKWIDPSKSRMFRDKSPSHLGLRYFWEEDEISSMRRQGNEVPGGEQ